MGLSLREIRLLEALLRHPEGLTSEGLADRLDVSARTVHRDFESASEFLDTRGLALVRQSGRGVRVEGATEERERALEALRGMDATARAPEERRLSLLRELLGSGEPIKLRALASGLKVSVGTVSRYLDGVESWLADFRLALLRKPGYGVEVVGTESDHRRAMSYLILQNLDEAALLSYPDNSGEPSGSPVADSIAEQLMGMVDEDLLRRTGALTMAAVERLPYAIADSALVSLSVHVALMVERLMRGRKIEMDEQTLRRFRGEEEYEYARGLAEAIAEDFEIEVPEEEVAYVTMHLRGTKLRDDDALERYFESADLEVASRVNALIHYVEEQTGVSSPGIAYSTRGFWLTRTGPYTVCGRIWVSTIPCSPR